jgi:hypothetical protein
MASTDSKPAAGSAAPSSSAAASTSSSAPAPAKTAVPDESPKQMFKRWAMAAVSAVAAETATFPIDFTKTRLQLQNELGKSVVGSAATEKLGMVRMFRQILATEGLAAMYMGLGAAGLRQAVYGGLGVGLYAPVRKLIIGDQDPKEAALW